jgi:hypothetical protein
LKNYITEYYKGLFGPHTPNSFSIDETLRHDIPQVSEDENEELMAPFSEEVKLAVFDMEHNKASCWMVFLQNLSILLGTSETGFNEPFYEFHAGRLPIHSLNFGIITLLPKIADAARIQQYRSICLLNVSFNFFMKVLNNRILKVADRMIGPSHTAFIPG